MKKHEAGIYSLVADLYYDTTLHKVSWKDPACPQATLVKSCVKQEVFETNWCDTFVQFSTSADLEAVRWLKLNSAPVETGELVVILLRLIAKCVREQNNHDI